jgi:hypothetical protein
MANYGREIDAALQSTEPIPRDRVLLWIEGATDLRTLSKLYRLTDEGYYRIQPDLGGGVACALIQRYLLECIRENVTDDDEIMSRFDAAMTLHGWLRHLLAMKDADNVLQSAARAVTELFLASGEDVRYTIETGFLEHALETTALRPYFEHWSADTRLRPAWERALEWGNAHPNYMAGLFDTIGGPKEE